MFKYNYLSFAVQILDLADLSNVIYAATATIKVMQVIIHSDN